MRIHSKAHAVPGHSKAVNYRNGLFSVCSDLEAMVDAYGLAAVIEYATKIQKDLSTIGDSIYNARYNGEMNSLPVPRLRKQNKTKAVRKWVH